MPSDKFFSLPLEQQVGQFFFIGLPGTEIDQDARELIKEIQPGGIILFGRNVESPLQVRKLLDEARALIPTTVLCGVDQEGGLVDRMREIFPPMPSARALRQHGDLAGVRTLGRVTGELLRMQGTHYLGEDRAGAGHEPGLRPSRLQIDHTLTKSKTLGAIAPFSSQHFA